MNVGTRSLLFGYHCFFLHPWFVALGWWKLYGFPWDPRLWVAFFVHDLGYWGKPNIDGPESESHVELGAKIMGRLFDPKNAGLVGKWEIVQEELSSGSSRYNRETQLFEFYAGERTTVAALRWSIPDGCGYYKYVRCGVDDPAQMQRLQRVCDGLNRIGLVPAGYPQNGPLGRWHDFTLYHSRFRARQDGRAISKLCVADKYATALYPTWLALGLLSLSGEIHEARRLTVKGKYADLNADHESVWVWWEGARQYLRVWVKQNK